MKKCYHYMANTSKRNTMLTLTVLMSLGVALSKAHCFPQQPISWSGEALSFPSDSLRKLYKDTGEYIPKSILAIKGVVKHDKLILLTPRCKSGVPASLVMYDTRSKTGATRFTPYPSLEDHAKGNCQVIQNAVDMHLDILGLLWVLDTGIVNNMELPEQLCQPKVVCISLVSGRILRTTPLSHLAEPDSRLQHLIADYDIDGKAHLYIGDAKNRQVLVYNVDQDSGFRVSLPQDVASTTFPQDVMYMAIARRPTEQAVLYITYLNGSRLVSIDTQYLKSGDADGVIEDVGEKTGPMIFLGTNQYTKIFFRYRDNSDIYVWDTTQPFDAKSLTPIYSSEDWFIPTAVVVDKFKCYKVLESTYQDYYEEDKAFGAMQQLVDLTIN